MDENKQCAYTALGYDETIPYPIGERIPSKRVCRFCGKSLPEVKFRKKAHALSESIGNKYIIGYEECDVCNEFFSSIEEDFYRRHAFHLTCYNVKGKNGARKVKSNEMTAFNKNDILILNPHVQYQNCYSENNGVGKLDFSFLLNCHPHTPQNVYKALVKYALSTIDSKYLPYFSQTITWITNPILNFKTLPKVVFYNIPFITHPRIINYIRKDDNDKFPFAFTTVEFTNLGYFFIIPLGNNEPISGYKYVNFCQAFKQLHENIPFIEVDLQNTKQVCTKTKIEIDNIIPNQTCFQMLASEFL